MLLVDEPYHITLEVVNERCKGLRLLRELGVGGYKLEDIRGLPGGLTRHLIKVPLGQADQVPEGSFSGVRAGG